jgi:hypothetical protein
VELGRGAGGDDVDRQQERRHHVRGVSRCLHAPSRVSKAFSDAHTYKGEGAIYTTVHNGGLFSVHVQIPTSRKAGSYKISALCGHFP